MQSSPSIEAVDEIGSALPRVYNKTLEPQQIRLLKLLPGSEEDILRGELIIITSIHRGDGDEIVHGKDPAIDYEALSYVWGPPNFTNSILLSGLELKITPALYNALKRLRYSEESRFIWCDAICINQNNNEEKSFQVQQMFDIFSMANRVVVWLGDAGPDTEEAMRYLQMSDMKKWEIENPHKPGRTFMENLGRFRIGVACWDLCNRPWFRRVWIQQEVFAAKKVVVYCGAFEMPLSLFKVFADGAFAFAGVPLERDWKRYQKIYPEFEAEVLRLIRSRPPDGSLNHGSFLSDLIDLMRPADSAFREALDYQRRVGKRAQCECALLPEKRQWPPTNPECVLKLYRPLHASQIADHVYGLLGMMNCDVDASKAYRETSEPRERAWKPVLKVDYSRCASTVFQDLTKYIINRDRTIRVLSRFQSLHLPRGRLTGHENDEDEDIGLPSWCPDWRCSRFRHCGLSFSHVPEDGLDFKVPWQDDEAIGMLLVAGMKVAELCSVECRMESELKNLSHDEYKAGIWTVEPLEKESYFKVFDVIDYGVNDIDIGFNVVEWDTRFSGQFLYRTTQWRVASQIQISGLRDLSVGITFHVTDLSIEDILVRDGKSWKRDKGSVDELVILRPMDAQGFQYVGQATLWRQSNHGSAESVKQNEGQECVLETFKVY